MQDIADNFAMQNLTGVAGGSLGVIGEGSESTAALSRPSRRMTNRRRGRKSRAVPIQSVSYGMASEANGEASVPKLLVLTAWVPYDDFDGYIVTSVKNGFEGLSDKLPVDRGFDGIYLEYEPGEKVNVILLVCAFPFFPVPVSKTVFFILDLQRNA